MAIVYGIDLGTTYSCITSCNDRNEISTMHPSNAISGGVNVPSVIYFEKGTGKPIVGRSAKNSLGVAGEEPRIMSFTKRYMGEDYYPEERLINNKMTKVSPVEGSACILHHLLKNANEEMMANGEEPTTKAVITIPAGFTNKQRECTKAAAELAGIEVLGLVHEPTAAAISYGIKSGETILVFDLGGGTLDVSLVTNIRGNYKVLATAGDYDVLGHYLGGKDWDEKLMELAIKKKGYVFGKVNLPEETEKWIMRNQIEECKISLSSMPESQLMLPNFNIETIKRDDFEKITNDLMSDCMKVVKAAIDKADKESKNGPVIINRCVMSGASSNMPMVRNRLSTYLAPRIANGRSESQWLYLSKPETAISEGAALYANMLEKGTATSENVLVSVEEKSSHSYGTTFVRASTGKKGLKNLILSTDPMVFVSEPFSFGVSKDGQTTIPVDLYENNSSKRNIPFSDEYKKIYDDVYKFDPKTKVTKQTSVTFIAERDKDGIISIHVQSTGHSTNDYKGIKASQPPITDEVRKHIKASIELMDSIPDERK